MLDTRNKAPQPPARNYNETRVVSIIGAGTIVSGDIRSEGTIRIEGQVSGKVQCNDTIVVQETGKVRADLIGGQVVISGDVQGNIYAHDRLEITPTGKVVGDITAPRISIAEGVLFEGKCTMKPPGQLKPPADSDLAKEAARASNEGGKPGKPQNSGATQQDLPNAKS